MCKRARACDASATSPFFFGNRVQLSPWWAKPSIRDVGSELPACTGRISRGQETPNSHRAAKQAAIQDEFGIGGFDPRFEPTVSVLPQTGGSAVYLLIYLTPVAAVIRDAAASELTPRPKGRGTATPSRRHGATLSPADRPTQHRVNCRVARHAHSQGVCQAHEAQQRSPSEAEQRNANHAFGSGFRPDQHFSIVGSDRALRPTMHRPSKLASLGGNDVAPAKRSSSDGAVRWGASPACLDSRLRQVINQVASNFGPVKVNSTCRSRTHNARVGGATRSKHLTGDAVDFSVSSNKPAVLGWLRRQPSVGGLKLYAGGRGHFHIDTGQRRTW